MNSQIRHRFASNFRRVQPATSRGNVIDVRSRQPRLQTTSSLRRV